MTEIHRMPSYEEMKADPVLSAAARRIWEDIYQFQHKTPWNDLPDKAPLGMINYRSFCLMHAWSALRP